MKEQKRKYTVIYADSFRPGMSVTQFRHIEIEPSLFDNFIEENFGWGNVWTIFEGHCQTIPQFTAE